MKKASFLFLFAIMAVTAVAQNIQVHYDLGHSLCKDLTNRPSLTTTLELFKPDKWGSTFTFTDMAWQASIGKLHASLTSRATSNGLRM